MGIEEIYDKFKDIKNVLDIGCYTGSWNYAYTSDWNITCLEPFFYDHIKEPFPPNCTLFKTNFFDHVPGKKFDLIVCKFVLEHQQTNEQAKRMIKKIGDSLKKNRLAYLVMPQGHSLSNTIYKAYFNIKLSEGIASVRDGGHFANLTRISVRDYCKEAGLTVIEFKEHEDTFDKYPYNLFNDCLEFYTEKGFQLQYNNMSFLCLKR